jgi:hypothetical protein
MTGPATHLGGLGVHDGHHEMISEALAAHAKIVDVVAQAVFAHGNS